LSTPLPGHLQGKRPGLKQKKYPSEAKLFV
jgi:hypothetical protein